MDYDLRFRLVRDGKPFFGPGPMRLAEYIEQGMSLRQAAISMGMAYSKAWRILNDFEEAAGFPLVDKRRGGSGGGGSSLTREGAALLDNYRAFTRKAKAQCDRLFTQCFGDNANLAT